VVLDVNDRHQHRVVYIGYALAALAQRRAQQRSRVVQVDAVHVGAEEVGQAVVRGRERVEWA
jgi:Ni,Fe-hydrogenase maturation factor